MVAVNQPEDVKEICQRLEKQELEAQLSVGKVDSDLYLQLLANYLFLSELPKAKFLWQRIPNTVKDEIPELLALWEVGKSMWARNHQDVFKLLQAGTWSDLVKSTVENLSTRYRSDAMQSVSRTYSTITLKQLSMYLGLEPPQAGEMAVSEGWTWNKETDMVSPVPKVRPSGEKEKELLNSQLEKVTQFLAYLEN